MIDQNQKYVSAGSLDGDKVKAKQDKQELKKEKKLKKSIAKNSDQVNYKYARKSSHWLWYKRAAIIFGVMTVVFISMFVLTKYLNYYYNFGPMDAKVAETIGQASWWMPFNKWNWEIINNFQNKIMQFSEDGTTSYITVVEGLNWEGTAMLVTSHALITNNWANAFLYIAAPISLGISLVATLAHFAFARPKVKSVMNNFADVIKNEAVKEYLLKQTKNNKVAPVNVYVNNGSQTETKKSPVEEVVSVKQEPSKPEKVVVSATKPNPKTSETTTIVKNNPTFETVTRVRKVYPSVGKNDLISEIYSELNGTLTMRELSTIYDLTFETIVSELDASQDNDVNIFNFGKFQKVTKLGHEGVNPATGEKIWIDEKSQLKFGPATNFKKLMEDAKIKPKTTTTKTTIKTKKA